MELLMGMGIVLLWIISVLFSRIITTGVHELGHALPALMFTENEVVVHIGSYGDEVNSMPLNLGRLKIFFKFSILNWQLGLCRHESSRFYWSEILIVLGGPFFSLMMGIMLMFWVAIGNFSDGTIFILSFFILSAFWDFMVNIIPMSYPIATAHGRITYNDGYQLQQLVKESNQPKGYFKALEFQANKQHEEAIQLFHQLIDQGHNKKEVYLKLIESYQATDAYEEALEVVLEMKEDKKITVKDYGWVGDIFYKKGDYNGAINFYDKYLYKNFQDAFVLNSRGYTFIQLGDYEKAYHDFNSAVTYDPRLAAAYSNRGLAQIRLDYLEEGWQDLLQAEELNPDDAYLHLHKGYYFLKKNDNSQALIHFKKAKELKIDFHGIDYLIDTNEPRDW